MKEKRHTQLFDLKNDPDELKNLAGDTSYADVLADLRSRLKKERVRLNDGNTPYDFTDKQGKAFWSLYETTKDSTIP